MHQTFFDSIAESREAFLNLVRNGSAAFYEVYSGIPCSELECLFDGIVQGELLLRFDMQKHSEQAQARFCHLNDLERRTYGLPADAVDKPIPYFASFVPGIGHVGLAWTSDDVRELIIRTRKDELRAKQISEYAGEKKDPD